MLRGVRRRCAIRDGTAWVRRVTLTLLALACTLCSGSDEYHAPGVALLRNPVLVFWGGGSTYQAAWEALCRCRIAVRPTLSSNVGGNGIVVRDRDYALARECLVTAGFGRWVTAPEGVEALPGERDE